ncbi:hypothetical protein COL99_24570 [Bacillus toyonensis]|uniref:hypothetical protein n=1 Tax=Bacillus cereus group TaxID=86661 RepID=UPI000BF177B9|nr:hypothetical protein [Bacillus toyonensis]PEL01375.1 hypothetical protein CN606_17945 [Bacillus toyonensis]PGC09965.1 hypothetical protein COL99_24570 [Bacillus toyonensis]PGC85599.1 hypothetical protein COM28_00480 [Bacillus toyonensis]PHC09964.1 hypothetical protein COE99_09695 [Bacillus toyonensis]
MERVIQEFFSPSKNYKVQIIKRKDGLYTTEAYRWMEDCGYEFWSYISQGLTLIDSEEHAQKIAMEQLIECSRESLKNT